MSVGSACQGTVVHTRTTRTNRSFRQLAIAGALVLAGYGIPALAADDSAGSLGTLHFGASDIVPCALRTHRIGNEETPSAFVHPAPSCAADMPADGASTPRVPIETAATWEAGYSDVDFAVGVVYRTLPARVLPMDGRETLSLVSSLQYGRFVVGASIFGAEGPAIDGVRQGYNLGANYQFGALRVATSVVATWTDGAWTGGIMSPVLQSTLDSLSVDLEYAFKPGVTAHLSYVEINRPDHWHLRHHESAGQRESTWTVGVSVGF